MSYNYTTPVETTGGKIRGYYQEDGIMVFKGVPYAEPPVGDLRWRPAELPRYREGVRDCVEFWHSAWQNPLDDFSMSIWTQEFLISNRDYSEDCLTLNLWAPEGKTGMPVILYFYGGGFVSGGSSCEIYDGTTFAKKGVIYITFTHREGVLAWTANDDLCRESGNGLAGNYMLSDTVAALKWIKENIEKFGGDPDNITIWGQSAGASEVNLLSVSPAVKDLFSRSISMGYNSFQMNEWKTLDEIRETGNELKEKFGGSVEKMREVPPQDYLPYYTECRPAIDGHYVDGQFRDCLKRGIGAEKPFMLGCVAQDGRIMKWYQKLLGCADIGALRQFLAENFANSAKDLEKTYFSDENNFKPGIFPFLHDLLLKGMLEMAKTRAAAAPGCPTYLYLFNHVMPGPNAGFLGAFHSFEVPYFTNHFTDLRKDYWTDADRALGVKMNAEFVHYAKYGRPLSDDFKTSDGTNIYMINTDEQHNELISDERYEELMYLFGDK